MIYKGLKYPFNSSYNEVVATSSDNDIIRESILQIIQTATGERVMKPEFGCKLMDYIFDNENELMIENIKNELIRAISLFEPRAKITDIKIELIEDNIIDITLTYDTNFKENNSISLSIARS